MTRNGVRIALFGAGALAALLVPTPGRAQATARNEIGIYKGDPPAQDGIALKSWGSGEAKESEEFIYTGSKSIRVTTQGRYQGARLVLQKPVDLSSLAADPTAYLELIIHLADKDTANTGFRGGYPGGMGGPPPGMMAGMMGGRGGPGGRGGGGPGGRGDAAKMVKAKPFANLRVVLVTTEDKRYDLNMPLDDAPRTQQEWRRFAVPVSAVGGGKGMSGAVKEILVFGDSPTNLYVGEIRVMHDDTPIHVGDLPEHVVPVNEEVTFTASAEAGASPLKYEWTFSAGPDGGQAGGVDAEGRTVKHRFRKSGDYTVLLKVSDPYGIKKPATTTTKVTVTL